MLARYSEVRAQSHSLKFWYVGTLKHVVHSQLSVPNCVNCPIVSKPPLASSDWALWGRTLIGQARQPAVQQRLSVYSALVSGLVSVVAGSFFSAKGDWCAECMPALRAQSYRCNSTLLIAKAYLRMLPSVVNKRVA